VAVVLGMLCGGHELGLSVGIGRANFLICLFVLVMFVFVFSFVSFNIYVLLVN
jgi:hypothetical protein